MTPALVLLYQAFFWSDSSYPFCYGFLCKKQVCTEWKSWPKQKQHVLYPKPYLFPFGANGSPRYKEREKTEYKIRSKKANEVNRSRSHLKQTNRKSNLLNPNFHAFLDMCYVRYSFVKKQNLFIFHRSQIKCFMNI